MHRRWVTSSGRQTVGRRLRRRILGSAAPGFEIDDLDLSFDFEDILFGSIKWIVKIVLILLIVPVVLVVVLLVGLVETIVRVGLRRRGPSTASGATAPRSGGGRPASGGPATGATRSGSPSPPAAPPRAATSGPGPADRARLRQGQPSGRTGADRRVRWPPWRGWRPMSGS
ncbi:MAG TPA: hypothetical protein VK507_15905 [Iamia sp.]|nr:hypothetical protein [Iamia sp.]